MTRAARRIGPMLLLLWALPLAAQSSHLVIVTGLGGDPTYAAAFHRWAIALLDAARAAGVPDSHVVYLGPDPVRAPARIAARSSKQNVERALRTVAERAAPNDRIMIVLFGHGSARGEEARFNLPGPDLTAADLAALVDGFPSQPVAVINTASASGAFLPRLSGERRVVITATKSGFERNRTMFGEYFAKAYAEAGADTDKDERVSLLEAFEFARREVVRVYEGERRLRTEHPMLDDNGDGEGSEAPDPRTADGMLARGFFLAPPTAPAVATDDPALAALYATRRRLEEAVAALRARKAAMDSTAYQEELEALLLRLARTNREIRTLEEGRREP